MMITIETCLVVSLAFAVFAAVTALGSSLVLGASFERLRAGFEILKGQTGFFSESLHKLDKRVDSVEKQSHYFFEELHKIEEGQTMEEAPVANDTHHDQPAALVEEPVLICAKTEELRQQAIDRFWDNAPAQGREIRFQ